MKITQFARRTEPVWTMVSAMVSGLVAVFGIVGGIWAFWQYGIQLEAERQKYTLELVGTWQEDGYLGSYDRLASNVFQFMEEVPRAQLDSATRDPALKLRLQENFTRRVTRDPASLDEVKRVVYFFKWLNICLENELCSEATATAFFDDTVATFIENYGKYIEVNQGFLPAPLALLEGLSERLNETPATN